MTDVYRVRFQRHEPTKLLLMTLLATVVSIISIEQANSRQQGSVSSKPSGAEVTPRGQRAENDITYGDWRKLCFKAGGAEKLCRTTITGTFATGQMAVRMDIIEREGGGTKRLQLFVPVGMYLQLPAKLTVDQGKPYQIPYTWCLTNTCIAAGVANPHLVKAMESGKTLVLDVTDSKLLSVKTSLPLAQFASVHKGAPTQMLEQDIDE